MRLTALRIRDYRTLECLDLEFPSLYSAICGANDSGKTNVVRGIRALVRDDDGPPYGLSDNDGPSLKDDYPKWKGTEPAKREISFEAALELDATRDAGFYEFVVTQLSIESPVNPLELAVSAVYRADRPDPEVSVTVSEKVYTKLRAQEVLKKLQSSRSILFHNSTETERSYFYSGGRVAGHIREITGQHEALVEAMKKTVNRGLATISKSQQAEFEGLLGRLQTKYKVGLSMPAFDFSYLPFSITLGDKKIEIPLDDWGSGTRNRTLVLLALFRARQIGDAEASASKITPIIVIEEPESFLHPAAQAEFGRVLQDLATEFQVQVVVTTHSPYLLNLQDACSNILLGRKTVYRQLRETTRVDSGGDNWMLPFGQALGLDCEEFRPWKEMMFSSADAIVLVEGDTDRKYLEMLQNPAHGANRLVADCEVVSYGGTGSLGNTVLVRFIRDRFERFFVTFDLDALDQVEAKLKRLQLERGRHYCAIGLDAAGKKNIEGLLPDSVTTAVYAANPSLVQAATAGTKLEQDSAKRQLKTLLLQEFESQATPGEQHFGHFYALAKTINKALASRATV